MKRIKEYIQKREFLKYFLMFFSGTLLAQIISVSLSPFLTRIYTPEDFGIYGVYISIISLLIVFVTGRYEFAINVTKDKRDSLALFKIVNYLSIFMSGFIFIILITFKDLIVRLLNISMDYSYLYYIPITLLFLGTLQSSVYLLNRNKKIEVLTKSKIFQSISNGITSISMGLFNFGAKGLILANIVGVLTSQIYQKTKTIHMRQDRIGYERIKSNLLKYKKYPLYNSPSAFFDNLAIQAPVFIFIKFFNEATVGFYSLTLRVVGMPLGLISSSLSQVFLSQISELNRNEQSYKAIIIKLSKILALIGILPLLILIFFGPSLFKITFGEKWEVAGEYARILSMSYYFKFIVSPLSTVFFINGKVKTLSIIQTTRAMTTILLLVICSTYFEIKEVLLFYVLHEIIFYLIYFLSILKTSK